MTDDYGRLTNRMDRLEEKVAIHETALAVSRQSLNSIKEDVHAIKASVTWTLRTIISVVLVTAVTFVMSGGLQNIELLSRQ